MKPKALLFDVFGTVVDWRSGIARDLAIHFQTHPSNTDPESVADAWRALQQALPNVTLYYAVKSNPYHSLLATLVNEGASFDVASAPEIQALLPFGVPTSR